MTGYTTCNTRHTYRGKALVEVIKAFIHERGNVKTLINNSQIGKKILTEQSRLEKPQASEFKNDFFSQLNERVEKALFIQYIQ